ncbi:MAG TPA: serine/threonine-protein kinase [Nonomuraea sp.]|nr:serine/threonine-protein kinase [Nonomuraea sp.]
MIPLTSADPHRLGDYWLAGRLGAGGQGVVYEAYGRDGERVAIKVPRFDGAEARARLAKEAAAARRVASFCTARVIEARVDGPAPYIVSEFVPGAGLRRAVTESGAYEGDRLRRLAIGVATALTAIHQVGIVHRDLKPDNILLGPDGPRVIDFGVAREVGPTTSGPVMGTPAYMAPEVLAGRGAGAAADLWAWGMVVLFAARGRDAIEAGEPMATVTRVLDFRPDVGGLPAPLDRLVAAALSHDPADRPPARSVLLGLLGAPDDPRPDGDGLLRRGSAVAGTLTGAAGEPDLGAAAEELYAELSEAERAAVPEVLLRMAGDAAPRLVTRAELPEAAAIDAVLAVLAAAGLVGRSGEAYELARPGLLQAWPRLRAWLAANRDGLPVHRHLADAAAHWDGHGRKPADLLHGTHLDRALRWAATERRDLTLAPRERAFLDAASHQARRRSRRRGLLAAALAVLLAAALTGLGLAEHLRRETVRQRDDALARELALRVAGLRLSEPRLARLLTVAAWRLAPELPEVRGALYDSLSHPVTDAFTDPYGAPESAYGLGRDGRTLAAVQDGVARIWDVPAHRLVREIPGVGAGATSATVSPDGRLLAVQDHQGARLWDLATGRPRGDRFGVPAGALGELEFDASGRLLSLPEGVESAERWWDARTGERLTTPRGDPLDAVSRDGRLGVVHGAGAAQLWDLRRGRRLPAAWLPARVIEAEFSAGGRALAVVEWRGDAHRTTVFALPDGKVLARGESGEAVEFAVGDRFVVTWSWGRELVVRRLADWQVVLRHTPPAAIRALRLDQDGRVVRLLCGDHTVYTLDLAVTADPPLGATAVALAPGGRALAARTPGGLGLWDPATRRPLGAPLPWSQPLPAMAFSGGGGRLAAADGRAVRVIDVASGTAVRELRFDRDVHALALSPDGGTLAVSHAGMGAAGGPVELWDVARGAPARTATTLPGLGLAFRPDGRRLLAESAAAPGLGQLVNGSYSPDGRRIAFTDNRRILLWDGDLKAQLAAFPAASTAVAPEGLAAPAIRDHAWSPDGRTIATYEAGARVRLWDVATRQPLGFVFDGMAPEDTRGTLAYSADGRRLYTATSDGTVRVHDLDERRVAASVCARAGRSLTPEERARHLPGVDRLDVCG